MTDLVKCAFSGCRTRFKRSGKHNTCPAHSACYVAGQYSPCYAPCLPCVAWMKGVANERLEISARWDNIQAMKDWFKKILRFNKDKSISVRACTDSVLLNVLNCRKGCMPPEGEILARLRAIQHGLDNDFPELPSPASVCPSTPSVHQVEKPLYYSQVVKGMKATPERTSFARAASAPQPQVVELQQPVAAGVAHAGGESSSLQGDATSNPLIASIYEFMSGLTNKFKDMEKTV